MSEMQNESQILFYQTEDGRQRIEVHLQDETVWLSQKLMAELFQTTPPKHQYASKKYLFRRRNWCRFSY
jgi:hypothetical protein